MQSNEGVLLKKQIDKIATELEELKLKNYGLKG